MESIAKADIFFVVTTVVVLVLGILFTILLVYAIRTARMVKEGVAKLKETVEESGDYIKEVKKKLLKQGLLFTLIKKFIPRKK